MAIKNFKTRNGIDVDTYTLPNTVIQATVKTNSITTIDTIPMDSFISAEYLITITQGSKIRTSKVVMHEDGTSVDMTEYGITETGGTISGVVISATTSSTNAVLQATITDAATTIARIKMSRNLNVVFTPVPADAPTIGTATGGAGTASITFTAPYDNGGAAITSYRATSTPGSITGTASSSPVTVSGLTGGTAYTFTVTAINSAGVSAASSASNSVTPTTPPVEAAYSVGGTNSGGSWLATVEKMSFGTETVSQTTSLSSDRAAYNSGMANSGVAGYVGGGRSTLAGSNADNRVIKIIFAGDSSSILSTRLSAVRDTPAALANSGTAGYFAGGNSQPLTVTPQSNIDKFAFSDDSRSELATGLSVSDANHFGFANSGTAGYFILGSTNQTGNKFAFSNDSRTTFSTGLNIGKEATSMANSGTAAYVIPRPGTTLYKMPFSNDTFSSIANGLANSKNYPAASAKSGVAGYIAAGFNESFTITNSIEKIAFSNDSKSNLAATLVTSRQRSTGLANSGVL